MRIWNFIQKLNYSTIFLLGFLGCAFGLGLSIGYFQLYLKLPPCTLCQEQRFLLIGMGMIFLLAALHNSKRKTVIAYSSLLILLAIVGLSVSLYQTYWQAKSDVAPICSTGLNPLVQKIPFGNNLKTIFTGTQHCFDEDWKLFSISIPIWSAIFFSGMIIINIWQIFRTVKKSEDNS
jgi:disulfide bond formation protein DsbB